MSRSAMAEGVQASAQNVFVEDSDLAMELYEYTDPEDFIMDMLDRGALDDIASDYAVNIHMQCRNAVAWIVLNMLRHNSAYIDDIIIVEGAFAYNRTVHDHCWLEIKGHYLDMTLAQFIPCPKVAIVPKEKAAALGYRAIQNYVSIHEWIKKEEAEHEICEGELQ